MYMRNTPYAKRAARAKKSNLITLLHPSSAPMNQDDYQERP